MSVLFMDGFDVGDFLLKGWLETQANSATSRVWSATNAGRIGGKCLTMSYSPLSGFNATIGLKKVLAPAASTFTAGVAVQPTVYNGNGSFFITLYGDTGATPHLSLVSNPTTSVLELRRGSWNGALIATSSTVIQTNIWWYLEIQATISDTVGTCVVRINGSATPAINFSGDTKNAGTATTLDAIECGLGSNASGNMSASFDDIYVLDQTGTSNNTFLGDVRVATLSPTGNGTNSQLTNSGGNSVNNFSFVNETPYNTTNYTASGTVGLRDTYAMADLPAGTATVFALQNNLIAAKSDTTTANAKLPLLISGTLYYGATNGLSTSYFTYSDIYQVNPNTTVAWTSADVNGLESGMEVA